MRQHAALLAFAALLTVAIGGPFAMVHGFDHDASCFLSSVASLPCLTLGTVADHLAALQRALAAAPVALAVVVLLSALLFVFLLPEPRAGGGTVVSRTHNDWGVTSSLARAPVIRWHARLTHSPTLP